MKRLDLSENFGWNNVGGNNGILYFSANDGVNGYELWKSDGTDAGTVLVKDIYSGTGNSYPGNLTNVNGTLYFTATDSTNGTELWKSDGTSAGTVLVKDIYSGAGNSYPGNLTNVNGTLYFTATDSTNGTELWKSDGTDAGTVLVKDIYSGAGGSNPAYLTNVNGTLYFRATDSTNGGELWKSDGTEAGTVMIKDIYSGAGSSSPSYLTNVNGTLYFAATDSINGQELWKSDGTEVGTVMVKDIRSGLSNSVPLYLTNVNGTLYFTATDGINGTELWKSDGTEVGTVMAKDIYIGSTGSSPTYLINVNGTLYFSANDGATGQELWVEIPTPSDTTPPTGTISINSGAAYANSTSVTLALTCTDTGGCSEMQFSNDNTNWSTAEAYAASKAWTLASGNGTKTVYVKFKDNAGNWSSAYSDTITLNTTPADTTAPTITASPAGWTYTSAQSVTLTCSDGTGSGCDKIYYTADGSTPTTLSTVYTTPITISSTKPLKFFAKDKAGSSSAVSSETYTINPVAAIDTTAPSNVTNLSAASKGDGSIYLSWTAATDADLKGYNVYKDGVKISSETITKSTVAYTDTVSGTTYTYKVTSVDMAGNESTGTTKTAVSSVQSNTPPSAPSSIKVEDTKTGGSLKVIWTANTEADLSGYKVYLGTSSGSYTNTYDAGNTTAYTVTDLTDGTKYYITVTAYDTDGNESSKSIEDTETPTTATATLDPPTDLTVTPGNRYLTLSWTGVSNVTGYLVYIGNSDGSYGTPARTTSTTYTYNNLNNNQTYYVAVSSYTVSGSDAISAESERATSSGTPVDNNAPSAPTGLAAATGTSGSVTLTWARAEDSDISGYMLAYKERGSGTFTDMASISAQWSYTITGLTDGTTYNFYLYAYDKNGNFSEPATTSATPANSGSTADLTPPSPPILSAVPGDRKGTLTITDTNTDTDHYNLYVYNQASEKYMPLASINGLSYEHSEGVENGKALVYVATAVDASGNESGYSEPASSVPSELPGDIPLEEDPPVLNRVDGYDVNEMAKGFGAEIGDLHYNPNADLTGDGTIDGNDQMVQGSNHGKKK